MANLVDYATDRGVALITLNDPPVNAFTHEMVKELDECITDARFDEDVQVLLITGRGDHCFSAGTNIAMLREVDRGFRSNFYRHASEVLLRLENTPKLVIAALNGHASGLGFELALATDVRVARKGEGTLSLPQIDYGILPGAGGVQRLVRCVGRGRATQLLLEGMRVGFEHAQNLGLVSYVWECESGADFLDKAVAHARRFLLPERPSHAFGKLKRAIRAAYELPLDQALALEAEMQEQLLATEDFANALQAWLDKREVTFQGR